MASSAAIIILLLALVTTACAGGLDKFRKGPAAPPPGSRPSPPPPPPTHAVIPYSRWRGWSGVSAVDGAMMVIDDGLQKATLTEQEFRGQVTSWMHSLPRFITLLFVIALSLVAVVIVLYLRVHVRRWFFQPS